MKRKKEIKGKKERKQSLSPKVENLNQSSEKNLVKSLTIEQI